MTDNQDKGECEWEENPVYGAAAIHTGCDIDWFAGWSPGSRIKGPLGLRPSPVKYCPYCGRPVRVVEKDAGRDD